MGARRPAGYVGRHHETIGSDILAVLRSLQHLVDEERRGPRGILGHVLGADEIERLEAIDPRGWYPIGWLLELMERLDAKVGRYALLRMGRVLFKLSHEAHAVTVMHSAEDVIRGFDSLYRHANRGEAIGGWRVLRFDDAVAEMEKTTPHHCAMEEGIIAQALSAVGAPAVVSQSACFREGAESCRFVIQSGGGRWRRSG
jgi:hypothetical protein